MNINSNFTKSGMKDAVILGGGLAGLSAAHTLSVAGKDLVVIESDATVGGLSKTIIHNNFRFDLGGHRFITKNKKIEQYVKGLLDKESLAVSRKSKIYMRGMFFDYPLKPSNSIFGLGIPTTAKILLYNFSFTINPPRSPFFITRSMTLKSNNSPPIGIEPISRA